MSFSFKARDTGVYASCDCGSRMFIPTESALKNRIVFCPCGEIEKVGKQVLNSLTTRGIRSHLAKKCGQPYRPTAKSEERDRRQNWFEELA